MIGVFGGTFDPPHLGHVILAVEARFQLNLERVLWAVTADPPHKPEGPNTAAELRVSMVQAAISGRPHQELSRIDIDRPGPHYATDTLARLSRVMPGVGFAYLMGEDSLRDLPDWHQPDELIRRLDALVVMPRPEIRFDASELHDRFPDIRSKLKLIRAPSIQLSASDIRARVQSGGPYAHLLPAGVAEIIQAEGLYR